MKVKSAEVERIQKYVEKINNTPLRELKLDFEVTEHQLDEWEYTGLSNWYFIVMNSQFGDRK